MHPSTHVTHIPEIGLTDVLVQVKMASICGTDLHIYEWDDWAKATVHVPMVIGHEFVGEIVSVGSNVSDFHPGEIVSGEGHVVCGRCRNCLAGRRHLCAHTRGVGVNRAGAFAEYIVLPMSNIWRHSAKVDLEIAAIFDPFGNAVHTALSFPVLGEDVLITGAGPIGIMAAAVVRHALANSLIPVLTVLGLQFGALLSGSIITETIFSWPGIGRLTVQAIDARDYPLVQGCILFIALCTVTVNLATDLLYARLDPRIRYE